MIIITDWTLSIKYYAWIKSVSAVYDQLTKNIKLSEDVEDEAFIFPKGFFPKDIFLKQ